MREISRDCGRRGSDSEWACRLTRLCAPGTGCSSRRPIVNKNNSEGSLRRFVKAHPTLRVPLTPIVRLLRKVRPSRQERLFKAAGELWQVVEGGSLIVGLTDFQGSFEIGSRSDILRRILVSGEYEPEIVNIIRDQIDPERDAVDVGANIGLFTILFARLISPSRRVLGIEPTPGALKYLHRNIERNHLTERIAVFEGVAAERQGVARINVIEGMEEYSSLGEMVHPSIKHKQYEGVSVPAKPLDSLIDEFALKPGLIKIDTEGTEYEVLSGCQRTMSTHRPIILCESWSDSSIGVAGTSPRAVGDLFKSRGYVVSQCADGELLAMPEERQKIR